MAAVGETSSSSSGDATAPTTAPSIRDIIVHSANNMSELYQQAQILDPALAKALSAKAVPASATPLGAALGGMITGLVAQFGLDWTPGFSQFVAGLAALAVGYGVHWIQHWLAKPVISETANVTANVSTSK